MPFMQDDLSPASDKALIPKDELRLPQRAEVRQGVLRKEDKVGALPCLQGANLLFEIQGPRGFPRRQCEGVQGQEFSPADHDSNGKP